jgi:hypothetical protein
VNGIFYSNNMSVTNTLLSLGLNALRLNTTATYNTAIGNNALQVNKTGICNTAVGNDALKSNIDSGHNCAFGYGSMGNSTGGSNCAFGSGSLSNTTVYDSCAFGTQALQSNRFGSQNNAFGSGSLQNNYGINTGLYGNYNNAFGYRTLFSNLNSSNVAMGHKTLYFNENGYNNTAIGTQSMFTTRLGINNTAVGANSDINSSYSTAVGSNSYINNASYSTAIGYNTYINNASYSTAIGYNASTSTSNQIVLGTNRETVYIPGRINMSTPQLLSYTTMPTFATNQVGYSTTLVSLPSFTTSSTPSDITSPASFTLPIGVWLINESMSRHASTSDITNIHFGISQSNSFNPITSCTSYSANASCFLNFNVVVTQTTQTTWYVLVSTDVASIAFINASVYATRIA